MRGDIPFVPYEPVDHTADLAYVARGRSLPELFENAALGMVEFLYDRERVRDETGQQFELAAPDLEELLVAWLQEILYRWQMQQAAYRDFHVDCVEAAAAAETSSLPGDVANELAPPLPRASIRARARGEAWDPARHEAFTEIKAVTYHGLEIVRETSEDGHEDIFRVQIVLDI